MTKKMLILVIISVFICWELSADIHGEIKFGKVLDTNVYKTVLLTGYNIDTGLLSFDPYFRLTNYFYLKDFSGKPFRDVYEVGAKVIYKNTYIQFYHYCDHPISYINTDSGRLIYPELEHGALPTFSGNFITIGYKWGKE